MPSQICRRCALGLRSSRSSPLSSSSLSQRCLHSSAFRAANPLPVTGSGPPPPAPKPAASQPQERLARARKQAELLKRGQELRNASEPSGTKPKAGVALRKRFWKDVSVKQHTDGAHVVHLDQRPVRTPIPKSILPIPSSKPHLATAIALEWDHLTSAQQALKGHNIPMTSIASRAIDIEIQDAEINKSGSDEMSQARADVVKMLLRYLDTDTLLCWAPEKSPYDGNADADAPGVAQIESRKETLRQRQIRVAQDIIGHLTTTVWPGVSVNPVLEEDSIMPASQPQETKDVIRGWLSGLPAYELAGLERAVLATKSLCVGTRLLIDWAEAFRDVHKDSIAKGNKRFGIEEAAEACSLEVSWQTAMWGEVEDSHDVEKEDLRRQLGSVILLVGGAA